MLEQHPVPQNVTTFQFRLIGDMTLKQFAYLAGGAVLAYISFHLPLPFFFTYPLTGLFAFGGIGFAFVPIEERPMDVWVLSFIKSVYNPTQYIWQRELNSSHPEATSSTTGKATSIPGLNLISLLVDKILPIPKAPISTVPVQSQTVSAQSVKMPVQSQTAPIQSHKAPVNSSASTNMPSPSATVPIKQNATTHSSPFSFLSSIFSFSKKQSRTVTSDTQVKAPVIPSLPKVAYAPAIYPSVLTSKPLPSVDGVHLDSTDTSHTTPTQPKNTAPQKTEPKNPQMEQLEKRLQELEVQLKQEREDKKKYEDIQQQLIAALQDKQHIQKQLEQTLQQHKAVTTPPQNVATQVAMPAPLQPSTTVKVISPQAAVTAGMPSVSTFPNIISGIVREKGGNLLVGILVTVKDKDDTPVRALKTNKLGQFAASTPLSNGEYILEVEDPKNQFSFDLAKVTLSGGVVPPVELIAKTKQDLDRQNLENVLFGKPQK